MRLESRALVSIIALCATAMLGQGCRWTSETRPVSFAGGFVYFNRDPTLGYFRSRHGFFPKNWPRLPFYWGRLERESLDFNKSVCTVSLEPESKPWYTGKIEIRYANTETFQIEVTERYEGGHPHTFYVDAGSYRRINPPRRGPMKPPAAGRQEEEWWEASRPLRRDLREGIDVHRYAAYRRIGRLRLEEYTADVAEALKKEDSPPFQEIAIWCLSQLGARSVVTEMDRIFREETDTLLRLQAVRSIAHLGSTKPEHIEFARRCLTDPDSFVRVYSVEALSEIGPDDLMEVLTKMFEDPEQDVRMAVLVAMATMNTPECRAFVDRAMGETDNLDISYSCFCLLQDMTGIKLTKSMRKFAARQQRYVHRLRERMKKDRKIP